MPKHPDSTLADLVDATMRRTDMESAARQIDELADWIMERFEKDERDVLTSRLRQASRSARERAAIFDARARSLVDELRGVSLEDR